MRGNFLNCITKSVCTCPHYKFFLLFREKIKESRICIKDRILSKLLTTSALGLPRLPNWLVHQHPSGTEIRTPRLYLNLELTAVLPDFTQPSRSLTIFNFSKWVLSFL